MSISILLPSPKQSQNYYRMNAIDAAIHTTDTIIKTNIEGTIIILNWPRCMLYMTMNQILK